MKFGVRTASITAFFWRRRPCPRSRELRAEVRAVIIRIGSEVHAVLPLAIGHDHRQVPAQHVEEPAGLSRPRFISTTEYGRQGARTGQLAALPSAHVPGAAPIRRETEAFSMYSDMSMRTMAFSSSNRKSASALPVRSLLTPVGPRNRKRKIRRLFGPEMPARERRTASGHGGDDPFWPITRLPRNPPRAAASFSPLHQAADGNAGPVGRSRATESFPHTVRDHRPGRPGWPRWHQQIQHPRFRRRQAPFLNVISESRRTESSRPPLLPSRVYLLACTRRSSSLARRSPTWFGAQPVRIQRA